MKISIVTPSFNSAHHIRETIVSVKNQSYQDFEHIVIDGQSTDGTVAIVNEYPHIKLVSEKDNGQSDAINKGLAMATGDILAWQNADDVYTDNAFETVVNYFKKHPEADLVYGYYQLIDSKSHWICDVYAGDWNKWMFVHGRFCPLQPTVFWRRRVSETVGALDENLHYCMDVDFFSRIIKHGFTFKRIPQILGKFRVHTQSKTQNTQNERSVAAEYKAVLATHFQYTFIDTVFFYFFQRRAKFAKRIKQRFLKKL